MSWRGEWRPYVPVASRKANARKYAELIAKKEKRKLEPVAVSGRGIASTFWGQAWCDNLESYSDFSNRLPRGRTYVRNGSVIDLQLAAGEVRAIVSGSDVYTVRIDIAPLGKPHWKKIRKDCSSTIASLVDLLQGRFSKGVMERLTRRADGLFPKPSEIDIHCSCPDWATLCKHAAAVLYGVGARLDAAPELLFLLRNVDHLELIDQAVERTNLDAALGGNGVAALAGEDLSELFGIELESDTAESGATLLAATKGRTATKAPRRGRNARSAGVESPGRAPRKAKSSSKKPPSAKKGKRQPEQQKSAPATKQATKPAKGKPAAATKNSKKPAATRTPRNKPAAKPATQSAKARRKAK